MANIDGPLFEKIKKKSRLSRSRIYALIQAAANQYSIPQHTAALLVARDAGVSYVRFAAPGELAELQRVKPQHHAVQQPPAAPSSPQVSLSDPAHKRRKVAPAPKVSKKRADAVFLVHGRDDKARKELSIFLRSLHVDVIEWNKALELTGRGSPYIGEVIDAGFDHAQAIVVMLTPDDEAKLKDGLVRSTDPAWEKTLTGQPRQNVTFEAGMAFGKYKDTTILVQIGKVRQMSDVTGIHIVHLTDSATSRKQLLGKLKTTGVKYDDSGEDWLTAGDFSGF